MIYTVTFNPSLDYFVEVEDFKLGYTNRTGVELLLPGGKGINVSLVLKNLGIETTALGFLAGFTGKEVEKRLVQLGIKSGFLWVEEGFTRINVKLRSVEGTEINGRGPVIDQRRTEQLLERLEALGPGDVLILAGSIPASLPEGLYRSIMERLAGRGIRIVVDAAGELLRSVLPCRPFLIKPNGHELGELFGAKPATRQEAAPYAARLQEMGAENVLVSLAGKGAVLLAADGFLYEAPAPAGRLVNGVGAGDAMVAGFLAGFLEKRDYGHAFRMAVAAGSASAFSEHLAARREIEALYRQVICQRKVIGQERKHEGI